MTLTITSPIIVQDFNALKALPAGTIVTELGDSPCDFTFELTEGGFARRKLDDRLLHAVHHAVIVLPVRIDNPQILGTFKPTFAKGDRVRKTTVAHTVSGHGIDYAEREAAKGEYGTVEATNDSGSLRVQWDKNKGTYKHSAIDASHLEHVKFEVGDVVKVVRGSGSFLGKFVGIEGTVTEVDYEGRPFILPTTQRPDGYGLSPFYWDSADVQFVRTAAEEAERIAALPEVGQRVEIVDADGSMRTEVGDLGTIVAFYTPIYSTDTLHRVQLDKDGEIVGLLRKRFEITDKPKELKAGDEITSAAELDSLVRGSAVTDGRTVWTKLGRHNGEVGEWARPNMFATVDTFRKVENGDMCLYGAAYYRERDALVSKIDWADAKVTLLHVPA